MGVVYFLFQEGRLLCSAHEKPKSGADYMIIMGAQVKGDRPSRSLLRRIEAVSYTHLDVYKRQGYS